LPVGRAQIDVCEVVGRSCRERPGLVACLLGVATGFVFLPTVSAVAIDRFQIGVWKDSQTLWTHVLALDPDNDVAHCNIGVALLEKGRVDEARVHCVRSLAIRETERTHSWLGLMLAGEGRAEEAIAACRAALTLDPGSIETHTNLGIALASHAPNACARTR